MPIPGAPPPGTVSMIPNTTIHLVRDRPRFGRLVLALIVTMMLLGTVFIIGSIAGVIGLGVLGVWIGGSSFDAAVIPTSYRSGGGDTIAVMPI